MDINSSSGHLYLFLSEFASLLIRSFKKKLLVKVFICQCFYYQSLFKIVGNKKIISLKIYQIHNMSAWEVKFLLRWHQIYKETLFMIGPGSNENSYQFFLWKTQAVYQFTYQSARLSHFKAMWLDSLSFHCLPSIVFLFHLFLFINKCFC